MSTTDDFEDAPGYEPEADDTTATRAVVAAQLMRLQALIGRYERRHRADRAPWGDPLRGQGRVLALLKMKPEISQRELSYLLDMSKQSLAELLQKLERAGLIERTPSTNDKRVTMITLTPAGEAVGQFDAIAPSHVDDALGVLSDDELAAFSTYLGRIIAGLEQSIGGDDIDERRAMMMEFQHRHGGGKRRYRDALDPRLMYDPRFGPEPDPRFGPPTPPDPRFCPPEPPDPRYGPPAPPDPRFGAPMDPRFDPRPRGPRGPRPL